ncbi:uncharacterized protein [Rhodnius prolixus]|uniref:uncharacterized protein n=1 Tax=Rhodnius prolixus TaxID=13249 RepID=UPI003D18E1B1
MERSMLGIQRAQKIGNAEIRRKTGMSDVVEAALLLKWNWAGHVARMSKINWARRVTEWIPLDRPRKSGTPFLRWKDDLEKFCGVLWSRAAQNKRGWKKQGEAFALRWA